MKKIYLTNSEKYVMVDDDLYDFLKNHSKWMLGNHGYSLSTRSKKLMHRLIYEYLFNNIKDGLTIDHINRNKLDNQKENLREVTYSVNIHNKDKNKNNTSGYKGIVFSKRTNNWCCVVSINNKKVFSGSFDTAYDAALAHDLIVKKYIKENIYLNFINPSQEDINRINLIIDNPKKRKGKSKYKGVTFCKQTGKWRAKITFKQKGISIGRFDTELEAAQSYDKKCLELFKGQINTNIYE